MEILNLVGSKTSVSSLPARVPTVNPGWHTLFLVLQRAEDLRSELVPVSSFVARWCTRPFMVMVLSVALFQAMLVDMLRSVKYRATRYRWIFVALQMTECTVCVWLVPTVMCYMFIAGLYAWNMELSVNAVDLSFQELFATLKLLRRQYTSIPETVFDCAQQIILQAQLDVLERDSMDWKVDMLTAPRHVSLSIAVVIDLCLWCSGFQDYKVIPGKRYR